MIAKELMGRSYVFRPCMDNPCVREDESLSIEVPSDIPYDGEVAHIHNVPHGKYSIEWLCPDSIIGGSYYTGDVRLTAIVEVGDEDN